MATLTRFHTKVEATRALVTHRILGAEGVNSESDVYELYDVDAIADATLGFRAPASTRNGFSAGHGWWEDVVSTADFWQIVEENSR